ncbi:MAG: hypothetical protein HFI70_05015 [Lachnospiraceae bacterium]|nr:hypothetical protein [Lachnospiraceae bacterium]
MERINIHVSFTENMRGSFTLEAAIIFPLVLLCTFWIMEKGIFLYLETVKHINNQEMWEEFYPAEEFRKRELLKELSGFADA